MTDEEEPYRSKEAPLDEPTLSEPEVRERFGCPDWYDAGCRVTGARPFWFVDGPLSLDALNVPLYGGTLIVNGDLDVEGPWRATASRDVWRRESARRARCCVRITRADP